MNHYIDIIIQPDAEMRENVLLNKVFTKFHKVLHDLGSNDIGASFPKFTILLGRTLRIHATSERLNELQANNWLGGLIGYCNVSQICQIPVDAKHRNIGRIQPTMSPSKLRRLQKRGSISEDEVKAYKAKMFSKGLNNPYLELESTSNGQMHRRYIQFGDVLDEAIVGSFDFFGLSKTATVPWF